MRLEQFVALDAAMATTTSRPISLSQHSSRSSMRSAGYHSTGNSNNPNMLKVVGASWLKTRISSMIIAGAMLLGVGSMYFLFVERPPSSGTYCATMRWTEAHGYRAAYWGQQSNLSLVPAGVARTCYSDSTQTNG